MNSPYSTKFCKDCNSFKENSFVVPRYQCLNSNVASTFNLVTGAQVEVDCLNARTEGTCGIQAVFWEPRCL